MQKDKIVSIDMLFDQDLYQKGEKLFANGAVIEINKLNKGLYNVFIKDRGILEVELLKPFTASYKATCECSFYKNNKVCKHVVASLLAYQKYSDAKAKTKSPVIHKHKSLNINSLLSSIRDEDLSSFVKSYASKDKKFLTALKVAFARKIELSDNELKYKSLLDTMIRPVSNEKNKASAADIRGFIGVTKDLYDQIQDALAISQFTEAFLISKAAIKKISYTIYHYSYKREELVNLITSYHMSLSELLKSNAAPELKTQVKSFLFDLTTLSYYKLLNSASNTLEILWDNNLIPLDELKVLCLERINKTQDNREIIILYALIFKTEYQKLKQHQSSIDSNHIHLLEKIVDELLNNNAPDSAIMLLEYIAIKGKASKAIRFKLVETLNIVNHKQLAKKASLIFCDTGDGRIIDHLKKNNAHGGFEKFVAVMEQLINKNKLDHKTLLSYYFKMNLWDLLMTELHYQADFEGLKVYDEALNKQMPNELAVLYESLAEKYLDNHIGELAFDFIQKLLLHLNRINATKSINKISLLIELKYGHRKSLAKFH